MLETLKEIDAITQQVSYLLDGFCRHPFRIKQLWVPGDWFHSTCWIPN